MKTIKNLSLKKKKIHFRKTKNKRFKDKKNINGFTNNPKYFGKKSNEISREDSDRKSSFKGRKKFKNRKRPKNFKFKRFNRK